MASVTKYGENVRVVFDGSPFEKDDVVVEKQQDGVWVKHQSFNSLSDDYAYTNAKNTARTLQHKLG